MFNFIGDLFREVVFRPILNLLLVIYNFVGDFGLSIILFAIVIKIILYPLLKSQLLQTKKMNDLKPEIERLKKKAKGDKQLEYIMTMNLYKQNGVKMSKTFVIAFVQLPIFISMFRVIRYMLTDLDYIGLQAYSFVKNMPNISHLFANKEQFKPLLFHFIDLSKIPFKFEPTINWFLIILILLGMAYVQNLSLKLMNVNNDNKDKRRLKDIFSEAADGKEPDQSEVNTIMMSKMNKFMIIFMVISFGAFYAGLSLYSLITGMITLLQRKIIMSKLGDTEIKSVDQKEVDQRLKKAKEAQIILENHRTQIKNKKTSKKTKKPVKKRSKK